MYSGSQGFTLQQGGDGCPALHSRRKKGVLSRLALLAFVSGFAGTAFAQGPTNDNFADGLVLAADGGSLVNPFTDSTLETGEPVHAGVTGVGSVWFTWTAPSSGRWRFFSSSADQPFGDPALAIYTGAALATLTEVASSDDNIEAPWGGLAPMVILDALEGQTYQIAVVTKAPEEFVYLNWSSLASDTFASAQTLGTGGFPNIFFTNGATREDAGGEPVHAPNLSGNTVWGQVFATQNGTLEFTVTARASAVAPGFEDPLPAPFSALYRGAALSLLIDAGAEVTNPNPNTRTYRVIARQGDVFKLVMDSAPGARYQYMVSLNTLPSAPNDNFDAGEIVDLQDAVGAPLTLLRENFAATKEAEEPSHAGGAGGASTWFRLERSGLSGFAQVDTVGSSFDTLLGAYIGDGVAELSEVTSNDDIDAGTSEVVSRILFPLGTETQYHIAVDGKNNARGLYRVTFRHLNADVEDIFEHNDTYAEARWFPEWAPNFNSFPLLSAGDVAVRDNLSLQDEDWFKFKIAPATTVDVRVDFSHAAGDIDIELYADSPARFVGRSNGTGNSETASYTNNNVDPVGLVVRILGKNNAKNVQYRLKFTGTDSIKRAANPNATAGGNQ